MKVKTLLLLLGLLLSQVSLAAVEPRNTNSPDGVSAANPGSELWREIRRRDMQFNQLTENTGVTQVKGVDAGILINSRGDEWARFRMEKLSKYGGFAVAAVFVILAIFFAIRGRIRIESGFSGNMVRRYNDFQRITHWVLAIVFLVLGITGLVLLLGRPLLIPVFGKEAFGTLAFISKRSHDFVAPLFLVSLVMMLIGFVSRNLYEKGDLTWVFKAGGAFSKEHLSVGFFNSGEKIWFWTLMLVGLVVSVSGLVLLFPNFGQGRIVMEMSHVTHTIGALLLICFSLGHMYMGSIGMEGAFEGMKTGYVDINWADEHHNRWGKECHDKNQIISATEYAGRGGGKTSDSGRLASD